MGLLRNTVVAGVVLTQYYTDMGFTILHISIFCVQEIDNVMYLELCHVSAARSLEKILFSHIHLFFTGKVTLNFENITSKSDVVLVTQ